MEKKLRVANFQHNNQILSSYLNFSNTLPLFTVLSKSKSHGLDLLNEIVNHKINRQQRVRIIR